MLSSTKIEVIRKLKDLPERGIKPGSPGCEPNVLTTTPSYLVGKRRSNLHIFFAYKAFLSFHEVCIPIEKFLKSMLSGDPLYFPYFFFLQFDNKKHIIHKYMNIWCQATAICKDIEKYRLYS